MLERPRSQQVESLLTVQGSQLLFSRMSAQRLAIPQKALLQEIARAFKSIGTLELHYITQDPSTLNKFRGLKAVQTVHYYD